MTILDGLNELLYLQKKAIRLISFQPQNSHSGLFFQKNNVLKFSDKNMINNILFISQALNNIIPPIFKNWLQFCYNTHKYCTTSSVKGHLHKKIFQDE